MPTEKKTLSKNAIIKKKAIAKKGAATDNTNYLTKRILTKAATKGFNHAAAATMRVMGYNVIVYRGWVVKKYACGRIEKIKKLQTTKTKTNLALD